MNADASTPEEHLPDLRLTIDITRPTLANPDGNIAMTAMQTGIEAKNIERAAEGVHSELTIQRALHDVYSYFRQGRRSFVARFYRDGNQHGR